MENKIYSIKKVSNWTKIVKLDDFYSKAAVKWQKKTEKTLNKEKERKELVEITPVMEKIQKVIEETDEKLVTELLEQCWFIGKKDNEQIEDMQIWNLFENNKFSITNIVRQFELLSILWVPIDEQEELFQEEMSSFFSLLLKLQNNISVNTDILWCDIKKETKVLLIKLIKRLWFDKIIIYIKDNDWKNIIVKELFGSWELIIRKIKNSKEEINKLSYNIKNLLSPFDIWNINTTHFWHRYSNKPIEWEWEDIAMEYRSKKNWIEMVFGFDNMNKAMEVKLISLIEDLINIIDLKIQMYFSSRDDLTWLLRRDKFSEEVSKKEKWTFIIFDIDNFKGINDTYWHNIWDEVIKQVTKSISSIIKNTDIICR